jgi:hypothetical protein
MTTQTLNDADLTDNVGLETAGGISVTNPLGGSYTVSLAAAVTKLGQPVAQGGAGITFAAGTPGRIIRGAPCLNREALLTQLPAEC